MSVRPSGDEDRRRRPRYSCGGEAKIICLPSDGLCLPGRMRDLSLSGCCVETPSGLDCGARTEILVRINSASFRAVSQVRAIRARSAVGMEFVHLSARGREMLGGVVEGLARLQALLNQLRSGRCEAEAGVLLRELQGEGFAILLNQHLPVMATGPAQERREQTPASADSEPLTGEAQGKFAPVDLFI